MISTATARDRTTLISVIIHALQSPSGTLYSPQHTLILSQYIYIYIFSGQVYCYTLLIYMIRTNLLVYPLSIHIFWTRLLLHSFGFPFWSRFSSNISPPLPLTSLSHRSRSRLFIFYRCSWFGAAPMRSSSPPSTQGWVWVGGVMCWYCRYLCSSCSTFTLIREMHTCD